MTAWCETFSFLHALTSKRLMYAAWLLVMGEAYVIMAEGVSWTGVTASAALYAEPDA